jgi:hypothetical protein
MRILFRRSLTIKILIMENSFNWKTMNEQGLMHISIAAP